MSLHEQLRRYAKRFFNVLQKDLKESGSKQSAHDFFHKTLKTSIFTGLFFCLVFVLFFQDILFGIIVGAISFAGVLFFLLYSPRQKKKQKAQEMEKDLPFFLMALGVQLKVGVPLKNAIENISEKEKNALGRELRKALKKIDSSGVSLPEALFSISHKTDSSMLRRSLSQINGIYLQGKQMQTEPLRSLAKEQLSIQKAQSREFNGKIAFYSLLFIAVSTVFPALFQSFVMVGSGFMEINFTPLQVLLVVALFFPLADIAVLFYIRSKTPVFLR